MDRIKHTVVGSRASAPKAHLAISLHGVDRSANAGVVASTAGGMLRNGVRDTRRAARRDVVGDANSGS